MIIPTLCVEQPLLTAITVLLPAAVQRSPTHHWRTRHLARFDSYRVPTFHNAAQRSGCWDLKCEQRIAITWPRTCGWTFVVNDVDQCCIAFISNCSYSCPGSSDYIPWRYVVNFRSRVVLMSSVGSGAWPSGLTITVLGASSFWNAYFCICAKFCKTYEQLI